MNIKVNVDIKTIRKAFVLLDLTPPSDEELEKRLNDVTIDFSLSDDDDVKRAEVGVALYAITTFYTEDELKKLQ